MRNKIGKVGAALAVVVGTIFAASTPASAAATLVDYGTAEYVYNGVVIGAGHISELSSGGFDIAVADKVADGHNICVRIYASTGAAIDYCDTNGSANAATHYTIYYSWYAADLCAGGLGCLAYV
jgi:hypothetical protein